MISDGRFVNVFTSTFPLKAGAILLCLTALLAATVDAAQIDKAKQIKNFIKEGMKLSRAGSLPEAEAELRKAFQLDENRSETKVELAYVLTKRRKLQEAYELGFSVADTEPKNSRAFAVLGATLISAGSFENARRVLYNALLLNRREHLAWAGFGMLDFYENRIESSLENLREAVFLRSDEPDYLFALAQVSARSERYAEAATAYRKFLTVSSNTDSERRDRIKGLINFLKYLGNAGRLYSISGEPQTNVNFELVSDRPIITLRLNGNPEPLRFVLDTGSGISVLSEDTAKRLKIKPITRGGFAKGLGGDGKFEIVYGLVRSVEIGDVELKNVPVYIREFHNSSQKVDGYIGLALISKFLTTIDYGKKTFALQKRAESNAIVADDTGVTLPLRLTSSGFLSGEVQLQGLKEPVNFIVDTGASVSVISEQVARADGIVPFINEEKLRVIGAAGITDDVPTFLLPKVTFGKHTQKDIMAVALDLGLINEASGFEQAGILGGNFLKNYRMTFDFKNSRVTFVLVNHDKD